MPTRDPEKRREINRRYAEAHKDEIRERARLYRARNREKVRERQRRWQQSEQGRESACRAAVKWRLANPEAARDARLRWEAANQETMPRRWKASRERSHEQRSAYGKAYVRANKERLNDARRDRRAQNPEIHRERERGRVRSPSEVAKRKEWYASLTYEQRLVMSARFLIRKASGLKGSQIPAAMLEAKILHLRLIRAIR